jgi:hypothetical protein
MLTYQQHLHFTTFGFVVLRGLLSSDEAATLRAEVEGGLRDAYQDRFGVDAGTGGIAAVRASCCGACVTCPSRGRPIRMQRRCETRFATKPTTRITTSTTSVGRCGVSG